MQYYFRKSIEFSEKSFKNVKWRFFFVDTYGAKIKNRRTELNMLKN